MGKELHEIMKELRLSNNYTEEDVAERIGMDVDFYHRCEDSQCTPNWNQLKILANMYGCRDGLLGASIPIVTKTVYPQELIEKLENAISECKPHMPNGMWQNVAEYEKIQNALNPIIQIQWEAFSCPNIPSDNLGCWSGAILQSTYVDTNVEKIIHMAMNKQREVMGWKKIWSDC